MAPIQFFLWPRGAPSSTVWCSRLVRGFHLHVEETKLSNRVFAALLLFSPSALAQTPPGDLAELRALHAAVAASQSAGDNAWMLVSSALVLMKIGRAACRERA